MLFSVQDFNDTWKILYKQVRVNDKPINTIDLWLWARALVCVCVFEIFIPFHLLLLLFFVCKIVVDFNSMETFQSKFHKNYTKPVLKMTSIEETIQLARLQQAANASSLYERKPNQKALKVLTVAAYILFVSMAAIILSFYYVFIWDPTTKTMAPRPTTNCGQFTQSHFIEPMSFFSISSITSN